MAMCMGPAGIITERRHASCRLPGVLLAGLILGTGPSVFGQDSLRTELSGYAEVYFGYDLGGPVDNERPDFLYNHKRHNEVAINLAYIKAILKNRKDGKQKPAGKPSAGNGSKLTPAQQKYQDTLAWLDKVESGEVQL